MGYLYAKFVDASQKIPLSDVAISLNPTEVSYSGIPQTVSVVTELTEGTDYTVSGDVTATGSAFEDKTYMVTIAAVDGSDYEGSVEKTWTIKAPTGSFAADALSTDVAGCTAAGTKVTVSEPAQLKCEGGAWLAGGSIRIPSEFPTTSLTQDDPDVHYFDKAHIRATAERGECSYQEKTKEYRVIVVLASHTYVDTLTWSVPISLADVTDAVGAGKTELTYELEVWASAWTHSPDGLRPTTFTVKLPIDENLKLYDEWGNQMYPPAGYVAQVNGQKMYETLAEALAAAGIGDSVKLIAAAEAGDFTVGLDTALDLGAFGSDEAAYLLDADDEHTNATVTAAAQMASRISAPNGFRVDEYGEGPYTYKLFQTHRHSWAFSAAGPTLTATCQSPECTVEGAELTLVLGDATKEYDGRPAEAAVKNGLSPIIRGVTCGDVVYTKGGAPVEKWYTGEDYEAALAVSVGGEDFTLTRPFSITRPAGGYVDGYEVGSNGVRYDTLGEALAFAADEDTICIGAEEDVPATIDGTTDKDITLDLNGKTVTARDGDITITNGGSGTFTIVNGTILQGGASRGIGVTAGNVVFGTGLRVVACEGGAAAFKLTASGGAALLVEEGCYQCAFSADADSSIVVTAGDFARNVEPYLAPGLALGKGQLEGYKFHIFEHAHDFDVPFTAEGNRIYMHCVGEGHEDCYYEGIKLTLVANDAKYDGQPHGATVVPDEGFPTVNAKVVYLDAADQRVLGFEAPAAAGDYLATFAVDQLEARAAYSIVDGQRVFDASAITAQGGAAAGLDVNGRTLTVTDGEGWRYFTAEAAPDGSGIEGWYAAMTVVWPNAESDGYGFTRPGAAMFEDAATGAFSAEEPPGHVRVETERIWISALHSETQVKSFTWWQRLTVGDVKAATAAGQDRIVRTLKARGELWEDTYGTILVSHVGDKEGVREAEFRLVANLKDLRLIDGEGFLCWPEHAHAWSYDVSASAVTATCHRVDEPCRYTKGLALEIAPKTVASKLCDSQPLEATLRNATTFADVTGAELSGVYYTSRDGAVLDGLPCAPGLYLAKTDVLLADGTELAIETPLEIEAGAIEVNGIHYRVEDAASMIEMTILGGFTEDMYITVGKDFTAPRAYTVPDALLLGALLKTKTFDLAGFAVTAAPGQELFINKGNLALCDTSDPQTGVLQAWPSNGDGDVPLIRNCAGAKLTIDGGVYLGAIVNETGGSIEITSGRFLERPKSSWLADGSYVVEEKLDGQTVYAVYPHVHEYKFIHLGPFVLGFCVSRDIGQGIFERSSCRAKFVIAGTAMFNRTYNGEPVKYIEDLPEIDGINWKDILAGLIDPSRREEIEAAIAKIREIVATIQDGSFSGAFYLNLTSAFSSDIDWEKLLEELGEKEFAEIILEIVMDAISGDALEERTLLSKKQFEKLTGAQVPPARFTTDTSLVEEIIGAGDQPLEGAPTDVGKYKFCLDIKTPSGNTVTAYNKFRIDPAEIDDLSIALSPEKTSFVYAGAEVGYTDIRITHTVWSGLTIKTLVLEEGRDYDIVGDLRATEIGDYGFTIRCKGNYTGSKDYAWKIVESTREFPEGSLVPSDDGKGAWGVVDGTTLSVADPANILFDLKTEQWLLGMTIKWPNEAGNSTRPEDAQIALDSADGRYLLTGDQILAGETYGERISATTTPEGYIDTITWRVLIDPETVFEAHKNGFADFVYEMEAGACASETNPDGVKATVFTLTIPLGNLGLWDCNGYRVYPRHLHHWLFDVADGRLVATCDASEEYVAVEPDCPYPEGATLALLPSGTVEYTGEPVDLRFDEAELYGFRHVTGALVSGVRYFKDGDELAVPPISVGTYVAQVLVTPMGAAPYAYEREFRITKPSGGYTDGFEVKSTEVRYDTMAEALAALAEDDDTIFCHQDISATEIDLTTDFDVTVDLCGKTVTGDGNMSICNAGDGVITLVNGTFEQPRHFILYIIQSADQAEATAGAFVFGENLKLSNVALAEGNYFTVTVDDSASLTILDGAYRANFVGNGENIVICGGKFWSAFDPTPYVPEGYVCRRLLGMIYSYEVRPESNDLWAEIALDAAETEAARAKIVPLLGTLHENAKGVAKWLQTGIDAKLVEASEYLKASLDLGVRPLDGARVDIRDLEVGENGDMSFRVVCTKGDAEETLKNARIVKYLQTVDLNTGVARPLAETAKIDRIDEDGVIHVRWIEGSPTTQTLRFFARNDELR